MASDIGDIFELGVEIFVALILIWVFIQMGIELWPLISESGIIDLSGILKWTGVFVIALIIAWYINQTS